MNDMRKIRIIIGILGSALLLSAGCGKKEVTFVQAEENREEESSLEEAGAKDKKVQLSEEDAYIERDKDFQEENAGKIFVYVCGAVAVPGVYELSYDARAFQAVERAGGFLPEAYEAALNLARPLEDGEQLFIPTIEEWEQGEQAAAAGMEEKQVQDGLVNINTASKEELCTLSGVGESRAESIIAYREANGGFSAIEEIKNVAGIKEGLFSKIKDKIKVK